MSLFFLPISFVGTFGRLYHGFLVSSSGATKSVYVKTVTDQASRDQVNLMLAEACLLYGLDQGVRQPGLCVYTVDVNFDNVAWSIWCIYVFERI